MIYLIDIPEELRHFKKEEIIRQLYHAEEKHTRGGKALIQYMFHIEDWRLYVQLFEDIKLTVNETVEVEENWDG